MKGEQRQLSLIPGRDEGRRLARRRQPAERRYLAEGTPDSAQILDELVGNEERLAVEALDQLTQPVDFQAMDEHRIVSAFVIEEAVRKLRQLAGCDQRRGGFDRALTEGSKQLQRHRLVGRHDSIRQLEWRHHDVERRQVGHVLVGDRHRDGAEVGGDLFLRPRVRHPLTPERIARPEIPFLPGHKGAAPQRAVGDDSRWHEQVLASVRPRCAGQTPARAKAPGDLQEGAGALAARVLEARRLVDDQHVEQRMIVRNTCKLADEPGYEIDADHRRLALKSGAEELLSALGAAVENGNAKMLKVRPGRDLQRPYGGRHELRGYDEAVAALTVADQLSDRRER